MDRLARLRELDKDFTVFGADEHEYRSSPMSEAEVEEFERWMTVPFPPAFRNFLLTVGTGAGPEYGIQLTRDEAGTPEPGGQFPFTLADGKRMRAEQREWQRRSPPSFPFHLTIGSVPGCIAIAELGCGGFAALVTTGELAGRMWESGEGLWGPVSGAQRFDDWYDAWLTDALSKLDR